MKYWQKIYVATLLLFLAALNIGAFLLSSASFQSALNAERERAFGEQLFLSGAMGRDLISLEQRTGLHEQVMSSFFKSYAEYYYLQGIFIELSGPGVSFSNLPATLPDGGTGKNEQVSGTVSADGQHYLYVNGPIPHGGYSLTIMRPLKTMQASADRLTLELVLGGAAISAVLAVALVFILKKLTAPIQRLNTAAAAIEAGDYSARASAKSGDEIGELAASFNSMAREVEEQVALLSHEARSRQYFIDNLAHEMRTPLTAISGYAEYLMSARLSAEESHRALQYIKTDSVRLADISEKLLLLAKLRDGEISLNEVGLDAIVNDVFSDMAAEAAQRGVEFSFTPGGIVWFCDETLLYMLILNLVKNAVRACGDKGHVSVEASAAEIKVRDDGRGMAYSELGRITEPFYRVDKARDRQAGGAGLGLALCENIAGALKLKLYFDSVPGEGTCVTILQFDNKSLEKQK